MATIVSEGPLSASAFSDRPYADWPAILAGTAFAAAISVVLLTFGSAIGFSMVSPFDGKAASKIVVMAALGFWIVVVVVFSSMGGGYLGGRLRRRLSDANEHEVEVRDAMHGLAIWGLGVLVAGLLGASGISGLVRSGVAPANPRMDPVAYVADRLLRTDDGRPVTAGLHDEIARLLAQGTVRGELPAEDKAYLAHVVAVRTGATVGEAQERVNDTLAAAKQTADQMRKAAILTAFLAAAALAAGAASAAFGAVKGGRHRDQGTFFKGLSGWR